LKAFVLLAGKAGIIVDKNKLRQLGFQYERAPACRFRQHVTEGNAIIKCPKDHFEISASNGLFPQPQAKFLVLVMHQTAFAKTILPSVVSTGGDNLPYFHVRAECDAIPKPQSQSGRAHNGMAIHTYLVGEPVTGVDLDTQPAVWRFQAH
jgi:hypothetical protein